MRSTHLKGSAMLLLCAVIWGFAFSAQDIAAELIKNDIASIVFAKAGSVNNLE